MSVFLLYLLCNLLHLSYESQYGIVLPSELLRYLQDILILHLLQDVEHLLDWDLCSNIVVRSLK